MQILRSLIADFVVLSPQKNATIERADSSLYERLEQNYQGFAGHELISCYEFSENWPSWECHPHGDEVVVLMSGEVTFVFALDGGESRVTLSKPGDYVIVPKGIWHKAKSSVTSTVLFITPGEGTQHRKV